MQCAASETLQCVSGKDGRVEELGAICLPEAISAVQCVRRSAICQGQGREGGNGRCAPAEKVHPPPIPSPTSLCQPLIRAIRGCAVTLPGLPQHRT